MQSKKTALVFNDNGFDVINFPCIEIMAIENNEKILQQLKVVSKNEVVIFTSQHAVRYAYKIHSKLLIPQSCVVIAVGSKTAQVLEQNYSGDIWTPQQQNSDGVIELLQGLKNVQCIHLITAANGRGIIQKFANTSNIKLNQINVYQRQLAKIDKAKTIKIEEVDKLYTLATSITTMQNLQLLLPERTWNHLLTKKILCASKRIEQAAKSFGFIDRQNMETASPNKMVKKLNSWLSK